MALCETSGILLLYYFSRGLLCHSAIYVLQGQYRKSRGRLPGGDDGRPLGAVVHQGLPGVLPRARRSRDSAASIP